MGQEGRETGGRLPGWGLRCVGRSQQALRPNPGGRGMVRGPGQQVKRQHDKTEHVPLCSLFPHTPACFSERRNEVTLQLDLLFNLRNYPVDLDSESKEASRWACTSILHIHFHRREENFTVKHHSGTILELNTASLLFKLGVRNTEDCVLLG